MLDDVDLLVCGAGPAGCVIAERAASVLGWRVLIVDKRSHIGGNCYDSYHRSGVLVHNYGPHYFRTNERSLLDYLGRFTDWIPGEYKVMSHFRGRLYPFPINICTLEKYFGMHLDAHSAERFLGTCRRWYCEPRNSEETVLNRVGAELYEAFYVNYTFKQWGVHPRELEPGVCGRIPVRLSRNNRYVDERYQVMPQHGFTRMFQKMVQHRRIRVLLNCDFRAVRRRIVPRHATVYTGPIDEYFDWTLGRLPYRSLKFEFVKYQCEYKQPCVQINYPNDYTYTRSVEIKHVTRQKHVSTVISYETPQAAGEPFYPIPTLGNTALYRGYQQLADLETQRNRVFFCGRLAQYRYFNTDQVILEALRCFRDLQARCARPRARSALSLAMAAN
jgi:UDP-galactopyranose mutase